jgi:hypothetical protein
MVMVRASAPVYLIMEARTRDARSNPVCGVHFTPRSHLDGVGGNHTRHQWASEFRRTTSANEKYF